MFEEKEKEVVLKSTLSKSGVQYKEENISCLY